MLSPGTECRRQMPLVPLIGVFYVIVGVAGLGVLLFSEPLRPLPMLSDRRRMLAIASGFAALIAVGSPMVVGEGRTRQAPSRT